MVEKFWVIKDFEQMLLNSGLSHVVSDLITFLVAVIVLTIALIILDTIASRIIIEILHKTVQKTKSKWDDYLMNHHFFRRVLRFVVSLIIIFLIETVFNGYNPKLIQYSVIVVKLFSVYCFMLVVNSFIDTINDIYLTMPKAKEKSIKVYVQSAKIVITVTAILVAVSIIMSVDLTKILLSLATGAAIVILVFKDTLLGFVASIQLSMQDMVRLGDWIVVEKSGANGTVIDLNINTCKVRNWDNTTSMVPIYMLVSTPFINWRTMEAGPGRRFKIPFHIDINSIKKIVKSDIENFENSPFFSAYYKKMLEYMHLHSEEGTTNISLFRAYAEAYLRQSDMINNKMMLLVRYLPMSDNGMIIELYGFSKDTEWYGYEAVVAAVTEQMIAAAITLDIKIYQKSTSYLTSNIKNEHLTL